MGKYVDFAKEALATPISRGTGVLIRMNDEVVTEACALGKMALHAGMPPKDLLAYQNAYTGSAFRAVCKFIDKHVGCPLLMQHSYGDWKAYHEVYGVNDRLGSTDDDVIGVIEKWEKKAGCES